MTALKLGLFGAALAAIVVAGVFYYHAAVRREGSSFTELYLLDWPDTPDGAPAAATQGDRLALRVGVTNREQSAGSYRLDVAVDGTVIQSIGPFRLKRDGRLEAPIALALMQAGARQPVQFRLYRQGSPEVYRSVQFFIDVAPRELPSPVS